MTDELLRANGVLIHCCSDWPCRLCRPYAWAGLGANFLCVDCAVSITAAAIPAIDPNLQGLVGLPGPLTEDGTGGEEPSPDSVWDFFGLPPAKRG